MKKISTIIVTLLSLASAGLLFILLKSYPAKEILGPLSRVGLIHVIVLLGLSFSYLLLYSLRWRRIIQLEGYNIPIKKLLLYRFAGFSFSYLTPLADYGGEPIMAYLLSKDNPKLGFPKSLASTIATRIISAVPEAFFIIISLSYILFFLVLPRQITFIFYVLLGLIATLIPLLYYFILKDRHPLSKALRLLHLNKLPLIKKQASQVYKFDSLLNKLFHDNPRELFINLCLSFISISSIIFMFWLLAKFLGFNMTILDAVTARSIISVTGSLIPVPANIGVGEGGTSAWFSIIGLGAAQGFGFYLLIRAKDILFTIIGVAVLLNKGFFKNFPKIRKILKENQVFQKFLSNNSP